MPSQHCTMRRRLCCLSVLAMLGTLAGCQDGGQGFAFGPSEPEGERWTIRCYVSTAPNHQAEVDSLAEGLKRVDGLSAKGVRTEHGATSSKLLYGSYRKIVDAKTNVVRFPDELTRDMAIIRRLTMGSGRPFLGAECELVTKKNLGPPEWDVRNAKGELTLQVATFFNEGRFQERELAAVQYVELLRGEGYEAFYYHDPFGKSFVCVGAFPASAVIRRRDGTAEYSPALRELIASKEEFQYNLVNGRITKTRQGAGEFQPIPSCLIPIPQTDTTSDEWEWRAP
ncbi:MAG: hypothetical protein JXA69_01730 [Phycisphaerae bacterium]|nr:hypothetical protein [Phycisphaerae bacterium]